MRLFLQQTRTLLVLSLLSSSPLSLFANRSAEHINARTLALAGATVAGREVGNPAALSRHEANFAQLHYENQFLLPELSTYSLNALFKNRFVDLALLTTRFGHAYFNESSASLNFSKELFQTLQLGVRLNYFYANQAIEDGSSGQLHAGMGAIYTLKDCFSIGLSADNIVSAALHGASNYALPWAFRLGVSYQLRSSFLLMGEVQKVEDQKVVVKVATEFFLIDHLPLRFGFVGTPFRPTFGTGYAWDRIKVDASVLYHLDLGFQPGLSLSYHF